MKKLLAVQVIVGMMLIAGGCATTVGTSPKGGEMAIEKAAIKLAADVKEGGYRTVGTDELKKWIADGKKVTIISTLPPEDDKAFGRIPGAMGAPIPKTEKELTKDDRDNLLKVAGADREQPVVVYCGFVACRRSHIGAKVLVENGFANVYRYPGGIMAWKEAAKQ